ncbi:DUF2141 domain-containing protein [Microbulbifer sp. SA54]|uniref:DUF2141 domain-containing protein n=1 Tax=Microbulbifer sp. SA54 TaxID=3401577 RepID=UPI003AAD3F1F
MINSLLRGCHILLLACMSAGVVAGEGSAAVKLTVSNIQSDVGKLYIAVYDSKDTFLGDTKVYEQVVGLDNLKDGQVDVELTLPFGAYAISVHHDSNANGKMDRNFIGIPKEPVGLSNGHVPKFGPPKFSKALIEISQPQQQELIALIN